MRNSRRQAWTALSCSVIVAGALLACKKKKTPTLTAPVVETKPTPTKTEPPAPTKLFNVGETAVAKDYKLKVANVKECKAKGYTSRPKKGNIYLGVEVLVESTADDRFLASPSQAKVVDGEGMATNYKYLYKSSCDPRLDAATQLSKGEKAKGWITFEVSKEASGLKLSYTPSRYKAQTVKFDLGR